MEKSINERVEIYKNSINNNYLPATYKFLLDYMYRLQRDFSNRMSKYFITRKNLNGYLDFTYFYFFDDIITDKKLKFGIIFNHSKIRFELWLMGTNKKVQINYWNKFKNTPWNNKEVMPNWYIISVELVANPDFENLDELTDLIIEKVSKVYPEIEDYLD